VREWLCEISAAPNISAIAIAAEAGGYLASIWSIEGLEEVRPDFTEEQCQAVLDECRRRFNAETGIEGISERDHGCPNNLYRRNSRQLASVNFPALS